MNLNDVMDELGAALKSIEGLRVFPYWIDHPVPPCAVVGWPEIDFDLTFGRGGDSVTFQVFVLVGRVDARTSRALLGKYLDGSGDTSVKAAIEGGTYVACDTTNVTKASIESISIASNDYLAAVLDVEVIGKGA